MKKEKLFIITILAIFIFLLLGLVKANLIISEVYFAGNDEWIELYNDSSTNFSGDVQISWAKSSIVSISNLFINPYENILFWDKLLNIVDHNKVYKTWLSLSIYDTKDLLIQLIYSWETVDSIQTQSDYLSTLKSKKSSLQKIKLWDVVITTGSYQYSGQNMSPWFVGNPWFFLNFTWATISTWSTSTWTNSTGTNWTGGVSTGEGGTGIIPPITILPIPSLKTTITEIFPWDENHPPFIELVSSTNFSWIILFSGTALNTWFSINLDIESWQYFLISKDANSWLSTIKIFEQTGLALDLSWWSVWLFWQSGQVLDRLILDENINSDSRYFSQYTGDYRQFYSHKNFSPGFDDKFLIYMQNTIKYVEVETVVYVCSGDVNNTWTVSTWSIGTWEIIYTGTDFVLNIDNVVFNPDGNDTNNETIQITLLSWEIANMEDFSLLIDARNNKFYYTELNTSPLISSGETKVFTGNYRFPNSRPVCVSLIQGDISYTTYCYDPDENISQDPPITTTNRNEYEIQITNIIYDPPWSDTNNEEITLKMTSWASLNLEDLRLRIWDSNRRIYGILNLDTQTFKWNYRFSNSKDTCISLIADEHIFDTYCYKISDNNDENTEEAKNDDESIDYSSVEIEILDIIYNPEWSDKDRESVVLNYKTWFWNLDLSDGFYFTRSGTRRSLSKYWELTYWITTITWNFTFPNSKAICVDLVHNGRIFDTFCYDPDHTKNIEQNDESVGYQNTKIEIEDIVYNPEWSDKDRESIVLNYKIWSWELDLSDKFYLVRSDTKKSLRKYWKIPIGSTAIVWNFAFPNTKPTCVKLVRKEQVFSTFCYETNITKTTKKQKKLIPTCKMSVSEKFYKNYIYALHNYLRKSRKVFFYNSETQSYSNIFYQAKDLLKAWKTEVKVGEDRIPINNVSERHDKQYWNTSAEFIKSELTKTLLSEKIRNRYYQKRKEYFTLK